MLMNKAINKFVVTALGRPPIVDYMEVPYVNAYVDFVAWFPYTSAHGAVIQ